MEVASVSRCFCAQCVPGIRVKWCLVCHWGLSDSSLSPWGLNTMISLMELEILLDVFIILLAVMWLCRGALTLVNKCQWETVITLRATLSTSLLACFSCQASCQRSWLFWRSPCNVTNDFPVRTPTGQERPGQLWTIKEVPVSHLYIPKVRGGNF